MNWDDLRIIAGVHDEGTYARAAAKLRLDETTVARRVARLQALLGVTLFDAVDGVRKVTPHGEAILHHIGEIARHVEGIGQVGEAAHGVSGRLRIASTPSIAEEILAPQVGPLLAANPGLSLQFLAANENVNFSRWEADLAIRLRKPERGNFAVTKLAECRLYLLEPAATTAETGTPVVCHYPEELDHLPESRYLAARRPQLRGRCITGSNRIIRALLASGAGIGILPDYMCGGLLADRRLRATLLPSRREVWLLVQNHLKRNPAARLVIDWLRESFAATTGR